MFLSGIGIDDMFVIVQCWSNMKRDPTNVGLSIADKMGIALKHAGVSVTVTSLTDVFAFGVGAVTVSSSINNDFLINMRAIYRKCQDLNPSVCAQQSGWDQYTCSRFLGL